MGCKLFYGGGVDWTMTSTMIITLTVEVHDDFYIYREGNDEGGHQERFFHRPGLS